MKQQKILSSKHVLFYISICMMPVSQVVFASDFSIALTERIEHSDNIRSSQKSEESDTIYNTGILLRYVNDSARYPTSMELAVSDRDYVNDSYPGRTDYYANIASKWVTSRERFKWQLNDRYRNVPIDILTVTTPDNLEDINYFSTGPTIGIIKTKRSLLSLDLLYEDFYFEITNADRIDYLAGLNWLYRLTQKNEVGVSGISRTTNYKDDVVNENYDRNDYFISLVRTGVTYSVRFELGETLISPESSPEIADEILRFNFKKDLTPSTTFNLSYNKELSDFSVYSTGIGSDSSISTDLSGKLFLVEQSIARLNHRALWGNVLLVYTWRDLDYDDNASDHKNIRADVILNISGGVDLSYQLIYAYQNDDWININRNDSESRVRVGVVKNFTNLFDVGLSVQHINHNSNQEDLRYNENRAILDLTYQLL